MKVNQFISFCLFLFFAGVSYGQDYNHIGAYKEAEAIEDIRKSMNSEENKKNDYVFTESSRDDTLIFTLSGKSVVTAKLTFDQEYDICDFERFSFSCDSCSLYFVKNALSNKWYRWRKVGENRFLSKYSSQTELTLNYYNQTFCQSVTYRLSDMSKEEYEKLYQAGSRFKKDKKSK